jgi:hypothetical protein
MSDISQEQFNEIILQNMTVANDHKCQVDVIDRAQVHSIVQSEL